MKRPAPLYSRLQRQQYSEESLSFVKYISRIAPYVSPSPRTWSNLPFSLPRFFFTPLHVPRALFIYSICSVSIISRPPLSSIWLCSRLGGCAFRGIIRIRCATRCSSASLGRIVCFFRLLFCSNGTILSFNLLGFASASRATEFLHTFVLTISHSFRFWVPSPSAWFHHLLPGLVNCWMPV